MHIEKILWEHIKYCYECDGEDKGQWEGKKGFRIVLQAKRLGV